MIRARLMAAGVTALLALGGLAWAVQKPVVLAHMDFQAERPLTPDEAALLARCESPGWTGLTRVVVQDLDVGCDPLWVSRRMAATLGEREVGWVTRVRVAPERSARARVRLDMAMLLAEREPAMGLAAAVADPQTSDALRDAVVSAMVDGEVAGDWADPALRTRVDVERFQLGDWDAVWSFERALRLTAAGLRPVDEAERARMGRVALDAVGVSPDGLRVAFESRGAGYAWRGQPDHLSRSLARRGRACLEPGSAECLYLAADLLVREVDHQQWHGDGGPGLGRPSGRPHPVDLPMPVWNGLYGDTPEVVRAAGEELGAWAAWIAQAPEDQRATRLMGAVAPPYSRYDREDALAGRLGDPVHAVTLGGSGPWTSALAAVALGEATGVPVSVHPVVQGVVLVTDAGAVGVGACGARFVPADPPGQVAGAQRVLAGAAVEAAAGALARQDPSAARRLASLAERLDPRAARGVQSVVDEMAGVPPDADHRLGWNAGVLLANVGGVPDQGVPSVFQVGSLRPAAACD